MEPMMTDIKFIVFQFLFDGARKSQFAKGKNTLLKQNFFVHYRFFAAATRTNVPRLRTQSIMEAGGEEAMQMP